MRASWDSVAPLWIIVLAACLIAAVISGECGVPIHPVVLLGAFGLLVLVYRALLVLVQAIRFALMSPVLRRWRLRVFQTNYGREAGWYVESDGRRCALLTGPRFEEMFWESYAVEPLADDPDERQRIVGDPEWWLGRELKFRNREFDILAPTAFVAGCVFCEPGRVLMRALYLYIGPPTTWERLWLWWLSRRQRRWGDRFEA